MKPKPQTDFWVETDGTVVAAVAIFTVQITPFNEWPNRIH